MNKLKDIHEEIVFSYIGLVIVWVCMILGSYDFMYTKFIFNNEAELQGFLGGSFIIAIYLFIKGLYYTNKAKKLKGKKDEQ